MNKQELIEIIIKNTARNLVQRLRGGRAMTKQELIERLEKASNVKNWHYEDLSTELLDITYELRNVFEHLDEPSGVRDD